MMEGEVEDWRNFPINKFDFPLILLWRWNILQVFIASDFKGNKLFVAMRYFTRFNKKL